MGMDVHPARSDQHAFGIDIALCRAELPSDVYYPPTIYRHVGDASGRTSAVDDRAVSDDQVVHVLAPF